MSATKREQKLDEILAANTGPWADWRAAAVAQAPGQVVQRVEFADEAMRITFKSGASLLHGPDGATHWRETVLG